MRSGAHYVTTIHPIALMTAKATATYVCSHSSPTIYFFRKNLPLDFVFFFLQSLRQHRQDNKHFAHWFLVKGGILLVVFSLFIAV